MKRISFSPAVVLGILLVLIGLAFFGGAWIPGLSGFSLWPLFLLLPVVNTLLGVRTRAELASVIFRVTYLSYLVIFFLVLNFIGWDAIKTLWPHFILAVAVAFLSEFLVSGGKNKIWETMIVGCIGVYFLIPGLPFQILGGMLLIFWGVKLLLQTLFFSHQRTKG